MEQEKLIPVTAEDLGALEDYVGRYPIKIDLVYAQADHPENMFKTGIYRTDARMLGHRDFVPIILRAALLCHRRTQYVFALKDCLRTCEAQAAMAETPIVKANPHWLEEPRLLSPPGKGGHPRGMAVDIALVTENGDTVDMGTPFDYLSPDRANNPSARAYKNFSAEVLNNRLILEEAMMQAAKDLDKEVLPLPQEWWDFRFLPAHTARYAPVRDADLPADMRMTAL